MKCPKCGGEWKPEEMKTRKDHVWRRRVCQQCSHTESTWEYPFNLKEIMHKILQKL